MVLNTSPRQSASLNYELIPWLCSEVLELTPAKTNLLLDVLDLRIIFGAS